jgi:large subunit ribosomal protein L35
MPKLKTRKSVAKRFKVTAKGKVVRNHSGHAHILTKKSQSRKRRLRQSTVVSPADASKLKQMLPYL